MSATEQLSVPGVRWITTEASIQHRCTVCQDAGTKSLVLEVKNTFRWSEHLSLYRCDACRSHFFQPYQFPTYESTDGYSKYSAKYYVEQEAGFESLIAPLASVDIPRGASLLEVGCGFGFAVSFARKVLGCDAVGVEPSEIAKMGSMVLGENIYCDYLENVPELADRKFGVVYSAQTIEHVPDPSAFLELLVSYLQPQGILILATPNAESISKQTPAGQLLETLAPGFHFSIFSPQAMESALGRLGFEYVIIQKPQNQMIVWASRQPISVRESWELVSDRMLEYLDMLKSSPNPWVVSGALQRLFRTQINRGQFAQADQTYEYLHSALGAQYGFDIFNTEKTLGLLNSATSLAKIGERLPYNLAAMYYYAGKLFLHHRHDYVAAERLFEAAFQQVPLNMKHRFVGEFAFLWWNMKFHVGLAQQFQGRTKEAYDVFHQIATQTQNSMVHLGLTGPTPELIAQAFCHAGATALQNSNLAGARSAFSNLFGPGLSQPDDQWRLHAAEGLADVVLMELKQMMSSEWANARISEALRARLLAGLPSCPPPEAALLVVEQSVAPGVS